MIRLGGGAMIGFGDLPPLQIAFMGNSQKSVRDPKNIFVVTLAAKHSNPAFTAVLAASHDDE